MSIQPGRATVLGQTQETSNPLLVLANALERQIEVLAQIATNTTPEARHLYAVHEVDTGSFLTYCLACSEAAQRFVFPCEDPDKAPAGLPPGTFTVSLAPLDGAVSQRPDTPSID